jgi:hypothetical protein
LLAKVGVKPEGGLFARQLNGSLRELRLYMGCQLARITYYMAVGQ